MNIYCNNRNVLCKHLKEKSKESKSITKRLAIQVLIQATSFPVGHQHHHHHHHHHRTTTAILVPKDHHSHSPMLPPSSPMDIKPLDWREEEEGGEAGATSADQMQDLKPNSGNNGWSGAFPENESSQQQQRNFQSVFESSMVPAPSPASPATAAVSRHPSGATLVSILYSALQIYLKGVARRRDSRNLL